MRRRSTAAPSLRTPARCALGDGSRVLEGIGGSNLYLVDRHGAAGELYDDWTEVPGWREAATANSVGLDLLDHLTHNVRRGQMRTWSEFYRKLFGFEEQKYFDIKGQATGLFSQAMIAPDRAIRIPLNESQDEHSRSRSSSALTRARASSTWRSPHPTSSPRWRSCAPGA